MRGITVLTEIYGKLRYDLFVALNEDALVKYCCSAKNALSNKDGFSPHQVVFGSNPKLPCVLEAELLALECVTSSESVKIHLIMLMQTREASIRSENSAKIRRAHRAKARSTEQFFTIGDVFLVGAFSFREKARLLQWLVFFFFSSDHRPYRICTFYRNW